MISYQRPSWGLVVDLINKDNGTRFTNNDIVLKNVRPDTTSSDFRDTLVDVEASECGRYTSSFTARYARLNIANVFSLFRVSLPYTGSDNTHGYLDYINRHYYLELSPDDVEKDFFVVDKLPQTLKLRIKPDCPAWVGELEFDLIEDVLTLREVLLMPDLPILDYPTKGFDLIQARIYFADCDFSDFSNALLDLGEIDRTPSNPVTVTPSGILDIINSLSPDIWKAELTAAPEAFNIAYTFRLSGTESEARIGLLYNGPIDSRYTTRKDFSHICVIGIPPRACANAFGHFILYYNVAP